MNDADSLPADEKQLLPLAIEHFTATNRSTQRHLLDDEAEQGDRTSSVDILTGHACCQPFLDHLVIKQGTLQAEPRPRIVLGLQETRDRVERVDAHRLGLGLQPRSVAEEARVLGAQHLVLESLEDSPGLQDIVRVVDEPRGRDAPSLLEGGDGRAAWLLIISVPLFWIFRGEWAVRVDRSAMETVFSAENLATWPEAKLPEDLQGAPREFFREVGLPDDPDSLFLLDNAPLKDEASSEGFSRCANLADPSRYQGMPAGWENWLVLGEISVDVVALDPYSGTVYSLPDGEYRADPLNSSIESFAGFLYLMENRRSEWDPYSSDEPIDPGSAVVALRASLKQADPLPFEGHEPGWSESFDWDGEGPRMPTWDFLLWQIHEG